METFIIICFLLAVYFLPTITAAARNHQSSTGIFVLNLLLGWTVLGWVVALVRSFRATSGPPVENTEPIKELELVENLITADHGNLTYRVMAYRRMENGELEREVWKALQSGKLEEPEAGGVATLVTDIGR